MESLSTRFRPRVPSPAPVLAVTVYVAPLPVTLVMEAPVTPVAARLKSVESTPVTFWENVTVQETLAALVGLAPARLMDETMGGPVTTRLTLELVAVPLWLQPLPLAVTVNVYVLVAIPAGVVTV